MTLCLMGASVPLQSILEPEKHILLLNSRLEGTLVDSMIII